MTAGESSLIVESGWTAKHYFRGVFTGSSRCDNSPVPARRPRSARDVNTPRATLFGVRPEFTKWLRAWPASDRSTRQPGWSPADSTPWQIDPDRAP